MSFADLIPQEGFLGDWVKHHSEHRMAPPEFHLVSGLGALSAAVGKGVYFTLGKRRYPTLWTLLLAPAGAGKSVALTPLRAVTQRVRPNGVLPSRFSPEAFMECAADAPDGLWIVGEIGGLFGSFSRNYAGGFELDLCDIWDHETVIQRKVKDAKGNTQERCLLEPALTVVSTGRASDFTTQAGLERFTSGFLSRFLIVTTTEMPEYRGLSAQEPGDLTIEAKLVAWLQEVDRKSNRGMPTSATFTPEAVQRWEADDRRWIETLDQIPPLLQGFGKRRGVQALKLAILHSISRTRNIVVDVEDVSWACRMVSACFDRIAQLAGEGEIGASEKDRVKLGIWNDALSIASADSGLVVKREFVRKHWKFGPRELDDLLAIWADAGMIRSGTLKRGASGPPARAFQVVELGREPMDGWKADSE